VESTAVPPVSVRSMTGESYPVSFSQPASDEQAARLPDVYSLDIAYKGLQESFYIPPLKEHTVAIPLSGKSLMVGRVGTQTARFRPAGPGTGLSLIPAGTDSEWCFKGDNHYTSVFLSQALVTAFALKTLDMDGSHLELVPAVFFSDPLVFHLGNSISQCFGRQGPLDLLYLESLGQTLAMHLIRRYSTVVASKFKLIGKLSGHRLKQTLDYIDNQPLQSLKIKELAQQVNLSPYHFERLFKAAVGKTVHRYVLEQQLKKGLDLLLKSDLSITEISAEIGFADQAHFCHQFKAVYGVSPGELRKDSMFFQSSPHENSSK